MTKATCLNTAIIQAPPDAPIDTYIGVGVGRFTGFVGDQKFQNDTGFAINFTFTDGGPNGTCTQTKGEPGICDTAQYLIFQDNGAGGGVAGNGVRDGSELIVLQSGPTFLTFGNHQAHDENKKAPSVTLTKINQQIDSTFAALDGSDQSQPTIVSLSNQLIGLFDQKIAVETNNPPGLAGFVYVDDNNNGVMDAGEKPIAGVT